MLVRTPLERPLIRARRVHEWLRSRGRSELRDLCLEPARIERAIQRLVSKNSNCIDVGCHLGSTLSHLIRLAPGGRHMAFEPVPQKAEWLRRKFPKVEIKQVALGDTPGKASFFESRSRPGFSGFQKTGDPQDVMHEIIVECERLDHYIDELRPVSFIKLDIEGAEFVALLGAVELMRRDRPSLLFESVPGAVEKFGQSRREFFEFLTEGQGYSIFLADDFLSGREQLDWGRFDGAHFFPFKAMNYLAIPR
jgi:FkbM family methyltransferase